MTSASAAPQARGYRYLEHTADVGIEAWGPDLAAAFEEAAGALAALMVDPATVNEAEVWPVELEGDDAGDLFVRWLSELIALVDTDGCAFRRFTIDALDARRLEARAWGERIDPARHRLRMAVKAATYHALAVDPGPPARVSVILDL